MIAVQDIAIVEPFDADALLKQIERAGRVCYKSEDRITADSAARFVRGVIKRGHEAVIEHGAISVRFICDRGVSHELVRHRLCAFCQESTRYVNYKGKGIEIIHPAELSAKQRRDREVLFYLCQDLYNAELDSGLTPQIARGVLPTALKTEIVATTNPREWRHIMKMRCDKAAHPQMRKLLLSVKDQLQAQAPALFENIKMFSEP